MGLLLSCSVTNTWYERNNIFPFNIIFREIEYFHECVIWLAPEHHFWRRLLYLFSSVMLWCQPHAILRQSPKLAKPFIFMNLLLTNAKTPLLKSAFYCHFQKWCSGHNQVAFYDFRKCKHIDFHVFSFGYHRSITFLLQSLCYSYFHKCCSGARQMAFEEV